MAAASKQIGSAEANMVSAGLVLWRDRLSAPLWPCGAGGQPRSVVVHRRVGALVMATWRALNLQLLLRSKVHLLILLRNKLTHAHPQTQAAGDIDELGKALSGKFEPNRLSVNFLRLS
jgi:hypothetical protein